MIRKRITFYGSVQGVGFRWRARQAANLYGCTGWCRNNPDGSVTMEIQGPEDLIALVLEAVGNGRYIRIGKMEATPQDPEPDECGFRTD